MGRNYSRWIFAVFIRNVYVALLSISVNIGWIKDIVNMAIPKTCNLNWVFVKKVIVCVQMIQASDVQWSSYILFMLIHPCIWMSAFWDWRVFLITGFLTSNMATNFSLVCFDCSASLVSSYSMHHCIAVCCFRFLYTVHNSCSRCWLMLSLWHGKACVISSYISDTL